MRRSWVEVDLDVLAENIRAIRAGLSERTEIIFVVKADAYGHGAVPIARKAAACGVKWFAVAFPDEAVEVRCAAPEAELLLLGVAAAEDVPTLLEHRIIPVVVDEEQGSQLAAAAASRGARLPVHVKVDTGMGRLGMRWTDAYEVICRLAGRPGIEIAGLCSHFAKVEPADDRQAREQAERFCSLARRLEAGLGKKLFKHMSSSRAFLYRREWDLDGVRPGIALYGYGTGEGWARARTRPILSWKARVIQVKRLPAGHPVGYYGTYRTRRETEIAVIAAGYADGYLRMLSNRGAVLIHGRRCPVVGRVSMNWITVEVGPRSGVRRGDVAVLIGWQGDEQIWADELAALCRTIPYEILTGIDARLERRYLDSGGEARADRTAASSTVKHAGSAD